MRLEWVDNFYVEEIRYARHTKKATYPREGTKNQARVIDS